VDAEYAGELVLAYTALDGHPQEDLILSSVFAIWKKPKTTRYESSKSYNFSSVSLNIFHLNFRPISSIHADILQSGKHEFSDLSFLSRACQNFL
jgi:hypothetical protein